MHAFIQQLPALIGVVIGALGSYVAVVRGDRVRFQREQAARWEERRLKVYGEYARTLKKSVTLAYRAAAHFGNDRHPHPLTPQEAEPLLAEATIDARPGRGGADPAGQHRGGGAGPDLGRRPAGDGGRSCARTHVIRRPGRR